ncbi:MAG: Rieske (2Fe-2S) protein [Kiloniellaceae bacterium]
MGKASKRFIRVGTLEELKAKGRVVVSGTRCPLLVVYDNGRVHALDNRCPHLGFPLHRGTIQDGILTCHWHHARFDLSSGGTFDLWADDVPKCEVQVRDGEVWVARECGHPDETAHWRRRLHDGMAHNLGLVIGKSVLGLQGTGVSYREMVREAALFGSQYRDGWGSGLTVLTALANLIPALPETETYLALYKGIRRVASDCDGEAPRRDRGKLGDHAPPLETLKRWLRHWTLVRHRDGAERTLLTAIGAGARPADLADLLLSATTDRAYADGGHTLDFINKAFECLDLIGWEHADAVLPAVVGQMVMAKDREESNAWRHPVDLVPILERAYADLPSMIMEGQAGAGTWNGHTALAREILADDPEAIAGALKDAIQTGATATDLSRALAYAAALRVARFGSANEFSDWNSAHHSFTYANALHQLLKRLTSDGKDERAVDGEALRGVFHGAMALYINRYLNVPPARLPGEKEDPLDDLPENAEALCQMLLDTMDRQQQIEPAARIVARYLRLGHPAEPLIANLARALLREDAGFHAYQMLEAGLRQFEEGHGAEEGHHILIAVARFLAAHAPTQRSQFQTASVAQRLHRGGTVYAEEPEAMEPGAVAS